MEVFRKRGAKVWNTRFGGIAIKIRSKGEWNSWECVKKQFHEGKHWVLKEFVNCVRKYTYGIEMPSLWEYRGGTYGNEYQNCGFVIRHDHLSKENKLF